MQQAGWIALPPLHRRVKQELHGFCEGQAGAWQHMAAETLEAQERLVNAQLLVQRLGLKASGPTESETCEPEAAV